MKNILQHRDELNLDDKNIHPNLWTAIIPVAGRGSRLNFHLPKCLYPVREKPILYWIIEKLEGLVGKIILVVSPEGEKAIRDTVSKISTPLHIEYCVQKIPFGMADALLCAEEKVSTLHSLVMWGDQMNLNVRTILNCQKIHELRTQALLTLPTCMRSKPYIHFVRDSRGKILRVLQARENEMDVSVGENDLGVFMLNTQKLFEVLKQGRTKIQLGTETKEFNFLPLIPLFEGDGEEVVTLRIGEESETWGINTVDDVLRLEQFMGLKGKAA